MNRVYKYFLKKYIFEQKIYFMLVLFTVIIQSLITMYIPLTYQNMLDVVFPEGNINKFWIAIGMMLVCYLSVVIFNVLKDYFLARIAENIAMDLRMDLNRKLSIMKYSYYDDHSLNEIVSKYSREVETVKENCGYMLVKTISNGISFLMATAMIIKIEWRIMIITAILLILYLINNRFWGKRIKRLAERSMEKNEEAIGALSENYRNVLITKLYASYEMVRGKFERIYMKQYKAQIALELTYSININSGGLLNYFLNLAIWIVGGIGIFVGNLTIGTVTALINYQNMLVSPLTFFAEFSNSYQSTLIAMKRLLHVLMYEEEREEGEEIHNAIEFIEFSNTAFKYLKSDEILKNVNLKLEKGNIYGFIGGSGCGKSTIIKLLLGLYMPAFGEIHFNEQNIETISLTKNLCQSYKNGNEVYKTLKNVSFEIKEGEFVAVMGPSGSGKSTLLNCISSFISYDSGEIDLNGTKISELDQSEIAEIRNKKLGFVFQDFMLLDGLTVFENVCVPRVIHEAPYKPMEKKAKELLQMFDIYKIASKYPAEISGGQRQRIKESICISYNHWHGDYLHLPMYNICTKRWCISTI